MAGAGARQWGRSEETASAMSCFDGNYPEPVPYDASSRKFMLEEPLELAHG